MTKESLSVLKDCKRVVELKFQNYLVEKSKMENKIESLTQQTEILQVKNCSLEERLQTLETEKQEQTNILAEIQQSLIEKTSFYESQIRSMQIEVEHRLDEINLTRVEEDGKVRDQYALLFNEKAAELMEVRQELEGVQEELSTSERTISDLEYREVELSAKLDKLKQGPDSAAFINQTEHKLEEYVSNTKLLQVKFDKIRQEFSENKINYYENIQDLSKVILELQLRLDERENHIAASESEPADTILKDPEPIKLEPKQNPCKEPSASASNLQTNKNKKRSFFPIITYLIREFSVFPNDI